MLPTIIADAICVIFLFIIPIYTIVAYLQIEDRSLDDKHTKMFGVHLAAELCTIILVVYLYIVEFSLYRVMVDKNNTKSQNQPIQFDA